jgi:hypothetical protein
MVLEMLQFGLAMRVRSARVTPADVLPRPYPPLAHDRYNAGERACLARRSRVAF